MKDPIDFVGIGAPKAATTWLWRCLCEHSQVLPAQTKELFFFCTNDDVKDTPCNDQKGLAWYESQFPAPEKGKIRGEFSTRYMYGRNAPQAIFRAIPGVKLVASLRNPAEAVDSWLRFWQYREMQGLPRSVGEAIREGRTDALDLDLFEYHAGLKRFFELFPRERILVILYDDIVKQPDKVLENLFRFLGIDPSIRSPSLNTRVHETHRARASWFHRFYLRFHGRFSDTIVARFYHRLIPRGLLFRLYESINSRPNPAGPDDVSRAWLKDYYKDDIAKLEKLLSRDLSAWK